MNNCFLELDEEYRRKGTAKYTILPIPYDRTSTYKKGADKGPEALIRASAHVELYDIETGCEGYRAGIFTEIPVLESADPLEMIGAARLRTSDLLDRGSMPVIIGGEHSVSIGPVQAVHERYPDLSVLQLDAHSDLREEYDGSRYNHACVMARIKEICPAVQCGIRSMDKSELEKIHLSRMFYAHDIHDHTDWIGKAVSMLSDNVYLTIDLDVFDPSVMPSTGTPEPGGLTWYTVLNLARRLVDRKNLRGFDVTELCPDGNHGAEFTAAKLTYAIINYHYAKTYQGKAHGMRFAG